MKLRPSTLVEQLQCPRCDRRVDGFDPEVFRGVQECYRHRCQQHWWAMRLHAGALEPQLVDVFDQQLTQELIVTWSLPREITRPMYWQLSLSRQQTTLLKQSGSSNYFRLWTTLVRLQRASLVPVQRSA